MIRILVAAAAAWLALSHPATASEPPAPAARLDAMAWLQGYWRGEGLGGVVEDVWMPPREGVMLGAFRLTRPDGKGFYELFAIEEVAGSLEFVVKHFHPDWVGWEEKDRAMRVRLTRIAPHEAHFGGVVFVREGEDRLVMRLAMRKRDGSMTEQVLRYRREKL